MSDIQDLTSRIIAFRNQRDWEKFHTSKDLAISLMLEASEVAEHFQWKSESELKDYLETNKEAIGDELADVLYWVLLMAHDFDIDIVKAMNKKMIKNEQKYPIKKAKGKHTKYTEL